LQLLLSFYLNADTLYNFLFYQESSDREMVLPLIGHLSQKKWKSIKGKNIHLMLHLPAAVDIHSSQVHMESSLRQTTYKPR
jgi:hypothetical protein